MSTLLTLGKAMTQAHYTPSQKAAAISALGLGAGYLLLESGGIRWITDLILNRIPRLVDKSEPGVQLGKVFLKDSDRVRHSHIVGSPGSGKTEATKLLIFEDIRRGRGCFIIDAKGDRELYDEIRIFCKTVGRSADLKFLSASYPCETSIWNPCGLGNASELQSKFLNANIYSEPYYAKACELGLLQAFNELTRSKSGGFNLIHLARELKQVAQDQKNKSMEGLFFDFGSLAQSEWAFALGCTNIPDPQREISLLEIALKNQILFVHLPTEGKSVQSSRIGRLLTQELILISGLKKSYPSLNQSGVFSVYVDEFDSFATDSFVTFLNKGRSSNFMIHLAHQTLSDLRKISQEFAGQVLGNCNIHLIFRQDDPDDAELWARFLGTKTVIKRTYQTQDGASTGTSSNRVAQEFIVSPDQIKTLNTGQCVISVKTSNHHKITRLPLAPRYFKSQSPTPPFDPYARFRPSVAQEFEKTESEMRSAIDSQALGIEFQGVEQTQSKEDLR